MSTSRVVPILLLLLGACTDRPVRDEAFVKENLLSEAPTPKHAVTADLGGKVVYLGADVEPVVKPGTPFTIVHYWKVIEAPGSEWRVFTHVEGQPKAWINGDASKMRAQYPPADWKAGDIVRDEQTLTLPATWPSPTAQILVGLYKQGSGSPDDRMPVISGPADRQDRIKVVELRVDGAKLPERKSYAARKVTAPPVIDGKSDAAWDGAPWTDAFLRAEGSPPLEGTARAKLLWDDQNLYVLVESLDGDVRSPYEKQDDPLWKADVVELFIDADGNRRGYVELQVNPKGVVFDSWFPGTRAPPGGDPTWQSGMTAAATVNGSFNGGEGDTAWTAEAAIPLAAVKGRDDAMTVRVPPQVGDRWPLNIVRVDTREGAKSPVAAAWAQIAYADFHAIDRLGLLTFADEAGQVPGPATAKPVEDPSQAAGTPAGLPGESSDPTLKEGAAKAPRTLKMPPSRLLKPTTNGG